MIKKKKSVKISSFLAVSGWKNWTNKHVLLINFQKKATLSLLKFCEEVFSGVLGWVFFVLAGANFWIQVDLEAVRKKDTCSKSIIGAIEQCMRYVQS